MTMPVERTRNLIQAGAFLRDLSANQHVPREIRTEAYRLLRHFPSVSDVAAIAENEARLLEVAKSHLLQNYLVADFDPEWVRGYMSGLDRPEFCRHSVAALRVAPFKLYR